MAGEEVEGDSTLFRPSKSLSLATIGTKRGRRGARPSAMTTTLVKAAATAVAKVGAYVCAEPGGAEEGGGCDCIATSGLFSVCGTCTLFAGAVQSGELVNGQYNGQVRCLGQYLYSL